MKAFAICFLSFGVLISCDDNQETEMLFVPSKVVQGKNRTVDSNDYKTQLQPKSKNVMKQKTAHHENFAAVKKSKKTEVPENLAARYMELPSDMHFNGQPMTQQLDLSQANLIENPDTLKNLALARYQNYSGFYPKSIACNFEEGTSTEFVHFPEKLVFRFEVFENEAAVKPYMIQNVVVRRDENGNCSAE